MLFNSVEYLVYLPLVAVAYFALRGGSRRGVLLAASYGFYWFFSVPLSLLLVWSTVLDYTCARVIAASAGWRRRAALAASLAGNLGTLAVFKYYGFFNGSLGWLLGHPPLPGWDLVLPMGISFYTFQTMSYTLDVYRGHCAPRRSIVDVALYVSFFPQLVAGPIMRGGDLLPQFRETHEPNLERFLSGALLCSWGLVKKVFVADPIGRMADAVYGTAAAPAAASDFSGVALLVGTYAFAVQIYCDFSAYSDIAVGSARILGFRLARNFDAPYLAGSIREFWRRWHITLSAWLRDYLYIPLGGSRGGAVRTCRNLMLTMMLGGLWHGANWTFVVWGGLHGLFLVAGRLWPERGGERAGRACERKGTGTLADSATGSLRDMGREPVPFLSQALNAAATQLVRIAVTFHLVCLAWVFFRAGSVAQAGEIVWRIVTLAGGREIGLAPVAVLAGLLAVQAVKRHVDFGAAWLARPHLARWAVYATLVLMGLALARSQPPQFIYFQF